eukprot:7380100-Prymnesium_polylepis.1
MPIHTGRALVTLHCGLSGRSGVGRSPPLSDGSVWPRYESNHWDVSMMIPSIVSARSHCTRYDMWPPFEHPWRNVRACGTFTRALTNEITATMKSTSAEVASSECAQ